MEDPNLTRGKKDSAKILVLGLPAGLGVGVPMGVTMSMTLDSVIAGVAIGIGLGLLFPVLLGKVRLADQKKKNTERSDVPDAGVE